MAEEHVRYAVIGCGSVSWNRYFKDGNWEAVVEAGGELVAVCDTDRARAIRPAEKFNVPYYLDLDDMLGEVDFDLLVNLTNLPAHYPLSLRGLEAGKHIYTQKPMALTVPQATALIEAAAERKLKLVAEEASAILPVNISIRALLDGDTIGKVTWIRSTCTHWGPAYIDNWPTDPTWFYQKGGGPLRDVGVERLHTLTYLLGPARRVTAMSGINQPEVVVRGGPNMGMRIEVTEDDITLLILEFDDSRYAILDAAWVNTRATQTPRMEIYGQGGVISLPHTGHPKGGTIQLYRDQPELGIRGWTEVDEIPPVHPVAPLGIIGLVHAVECIRQDVTPVLSGEHARHCIEIMEKAFLSARTGRVQNLETTF